MRFALLLLASSAAFSQRFPMRYLADLGHFNGKRIIDLGVARAREVEPGLVRLEGRDRG